MSKNYQSAEEVWADGLALSVAPGMFPWNYKGQFIDDTDGEIVPAYRWGKFPFKNGSAYMAPVEALRVECGR